MDTPILAITSGLASAEPKLSYEAGVRAIADESRANTDSLHRFYKDSYGPTIGSATVRQLGHFHSMLEITGRDYLMARIWWLSENPGTVDNDLLGLIVNYISDQV